MYSSLLAWRILFSVAALFVLGASGIAQAAPRLYRASLILETFVNDTTTGGTPPYGTQISIGIPFGAHCNAGPYHAPEVVMVTLSSSLSQTLTWTIPKFGGQTPSIDTNGDTFPDLVAGCGPTSIAAGKPLTGSGSVSTTGSPATSRTSMNPRGFAFPQSSLSRVTSGSSLLRSYISGWEIHYGDLRNSAGVFAKDGGDGSFSVAHSGAEGTRKAIQTAGTNQFGGVMRLLGTYYTDEGYPYGASSTSVGRFTWLFQYLGHGSQAVNGSGDVTAGFTAMATNMAYTLGFGAYATSTVTAEVFKWTTGTVRVTALEGTFPTVLERNGFDSRTAMGQGDVQMVSPMLTRWIGAGEASTAAIGTMKLTFTPEPEQWISLCAGLSLLGVLYRSRLRK